MTERFPMEELFQRFPEIAEDIFDSLDDQSLSNCQLVSRSWANYLNQDRFQVRIIHGNTNPVQVQTYGLICTDAFFRLLEIVAGPLFAWLWNNLVFPGA